MFREIKSIFVYAQKVLSAIAAAAMYQAPGRQIVSLDDDWKFALGHASDASKDFNYGLDSFGAFAKAGIEDGAMGRGFGDTAWRTVQVPHDWCVELPFDQKGDLMHGFKAIGRRFPENSIGWYRKSFELPKEDAGKRFVLKFDGIFRDAQVWVNGQYITRNTSGYMGFNVDVTKVLETGARNVIAVRVDASVYEGWFYEGAGIYRHVWLNKTNHDYLVEEEQFIKPEVNGNVTAEITTQTTKARTAKLQITDREGKVVAESQVTKLKTDKNTLKAKVTKPKLWSPDEPNLYRAHVLLLDGQTVLDRYETNIGFKSVVFDADKGLFINGKYTEIKGVCNHQDHAGVGAAVPDRLNEWRIERLKEMGCNALRTSHNPPTPELLDACDKLGILVQDENRLFSAGPEGISQMERLVKRDRNHASVFMWSLGNEEWGVQTSKSGEQISQALYDLTRKLDPTRTITQAVNVGDEWEGSNKVVDNRGFNYNLFGADSYHKKHPKQPIHGSEVASMLSTRGEYKSNDGKNVMDSYDYKKVDWGTGSEEWWSWKLQRPWFSGGFVWTGFDYRGEPTPHNWPTISSHFGIMDTCGFAKDVFYYYQSWWSKKPVLHVLPHWNWAGKEGKKVDVWVFSNFETVELKLNGKSLGSKKMPVGGHLNWEVEYQPGELTAVGTKGDLKNVVTVKTTGATGQLRLEPDRTSITADAKDLSIITVKGLDTDGFLNPLANENVTFEIDGPGRIIGVGNGDPNCHEPDQYITKPSYQDISDGWSWQMIASQNAKPDPTKWKPTQVKENQNMPPNSFAAFQRVVTVENPDTWSTLNLGPTDDNGWVYLNGELVSTTDEWNKPHIADIKGKLKRGENEILVIVKNNGGAGGFSRGGSIGGLAKAPSWTRSLYNGLAQVIVQSTGKPGRIELRARSGFQFTKITIDTTTPKGRN